MQKILLLLFITFLSSSSPDLNYHLPINSIDRKSTNSLELTNIGEFGILRKERPGIPAHYHTGIDIKRPTKNYQNEPIFSIAEGTVISKRQDGPYAQLIIEHDSNPVCWTVYEHIAGITVSLHERVKPNVPIARFMNRNELNKYGWQFDHFHFEILKIRPLKLKPNDANPNRRFSSYSLVCLKKEDLNENYHDPIAFFRTQLEK